LVQQYKWCHMQLWLSHLGLVLWKMLRAHGQVLPSAEQSGD